MKRSIVDTAIGVTRVVESNMAHAVRAVTSRRGLDPRDFSLVSFGGAGGLHACAIAEQLDIPRVIVPPYCGVLSALGMVVAPPLVDVSKTVLHLAREGKLDDDRLAAEYGSLSARSIEQISFEETQSVEPMADARFAGQSHELTVRVPRPSVDAIGQAFIEEYQKMYGSIPSRRSIEIVTLRLRRTGRAEAVTLPELARGAPALADSGSIVLSDGTDASAAILERAAILASRSPIDGPILIADNEATTFVPPRWRASAQSNGTLMLSRWASSLTRTRRA
jgi:N-methylhydantoinase A